jgi:hypothetical protein
MKKLLLLFVSFILFLILIYVTMSYKTESYDNTRQSFNNKIDAIYYINLNKRPDRKNEFLDNFNSIDESRIKRVSGHYYPDNGAVGCLMSHITALNLAFKDNYGPNILICEDDFTIPDMDYCNRMLELAFEKFPDWNVIMLGQNTVESADTGVETENHEKIIKILNSQTTSGYLIKSSYIPKLLQIYETDMNAYMKSGEWGNYFVDQSWKVLQSTDNWYSFKPSVAIQRASHSDIAGGYVDYGV